MKNLSFPTGYNTRAQTINETDEVTCKSDSDFSTFNKFTGKKYGDVTPCSNDSE